MSYGLPDRVCPIVAIAVGAYTDRYLMRVTNYPIVTGSGWYSIESGVHTRFGRHVLGFMFVVGQRNLLVALLFGFWP
jgi:hypothetical protein